MRLENSPSPQTLLGVNRLILAATFTPVPSRRKAADSQLASPGSPQVADFHASLSPLTAIQYAVDEVLAVRLGELPEDVCV